MTPALPVVPGADLAVTLYGKDQKAYEALPAHRLLDAHGTILTRWKLTWRERLRVLFTGDVYLWVLTFNHPLQPVRMQVEKPEVGS